MEVGAESDQNRWVELEQATAAVERERDALRAELARLRQRSSGSATVATDAADETDREALSGQLAAVSAEAEAERERATKLSEELQRQLETCKRLSADKFLTQAESSKVDTELALLRRERERLQQSAAEADREAREARRRADTLCEERDEAAQRASRLQAEFTGKLDQAVAEADFQKRAAVEARAKYERLHDQVATSEEELRVRTNEFAAARAALEAKHVLREADLCRESELREDTQKRLAQAEGEKSIAEEAGSAAILETQKLREKIMELEEALDEEQRAHESLLRTRIPGAHADTLPPEGFASLSELVREASDARETILAERQKNVELRTILCEVEREVRSRYPALLSQREEAERLREEVSMLTAQNSGMAARVGELERERRRVESESVEAKKSVQILESHSKEMARQLAILVHENGKLTGKSTAPRSNASDVENVASERASFRTVSDLAAQNEALRRRVSRLEAEVDTEAKEQPIVVRDGQSLQIQQQDDKNQIEMLKRRLRAKANDVVALKARLEDLNNKRTGYESDSHNKQELSKVCAAPSEDERTPTLEQQVSSLRAEFENRLVNLQKEAAAARNSECEAQQGLLAAQNEVTLEKGRCRDAVDRLNAATAQVEEYRRKVQDLEERMEVSETRLRADELAKRGRDDIHSQLDEENRRLKEQVLSSQSKVETLERDHAVLISEKHVNIDLIKELRARSAEELNNLRSVHHDLELRFQEKERLVCAKLTASEQRQKDLQRLLDELVASKAGRETELQELRARAEAQEKMLQVHKDSCAEGEAGELDAMMGRFVLSSVAKSGGEQSKLAQSLKFAEERIQEQTHNTAQLQGMIESIENERHMLRERVSTLESEVAQHSEQQASRERENLESMLQIQTLEAKSRSECNQTLELKAALDAKDAELAAARIDRQQQVTDMEVRLTTRDNEIAEYKRTVEELRSSCQEAVREREQCATAVRDAKAREESIYERMADCAHVEAGAKRMVADAAAEVEGLRDKLTRSESHVENLRAEVQRYGEALLVAADNRSEAELSEAAQLLAAELRQARQWGETQRQELELEKERLTDQVAALHTEVARLVLRLEAEQRQVSELKDEIRRESASVSEAERVSTLERENSKLQTLVRSLEERAHERPEESGIGAPVGTTDEADSSKRAWARERRTLETKADEWKRSFEELSSKFNVNNVAELKRLREEKVKWNADKQDLNQKMENLQQQLRDQTEKATQYNTAKMSIDTLRRELSETKMKLEHEKKATQKLLQDIHNKDQEQRRVQDLDKLKANRIKELEAEASTLKEDRQRKEEEMRKARASIAELHTVNSAKAKACENADRALALAADYQQATQSLLAQQRKSEFALRNANMAGAVHRGASFDAHASEEVVVASTVTLQPRSGKAVPSEAAAASAESLPSGAKRPKPAALESTIAAERTSTEAGVERSAKLPRTTSASSATASAPSAALQPTGSATPVTGPELGFGGAFAGHSEDVAAAAVASASPPATSAGEGIQVIDDEEEGEQ